MNDSANFQDLHWLLDVIQSADIGIVVIDRHYSVEIFNHFMQVHSGVLANEAIGKNLLDLFEYLDDEWFRRRISAVFELGIPVYSTWEQRDNLFAFNLRLPIHHENAQMFQNATFVPLRSVRDEVEKVAIVVYDVTDSAVNSMKLEQAKNDMLRLSRTDRLTQLWNRGYWEERLQQEFKRHQRTDEPICMVMFDIDHFKNINDSYGHHVGDEVIRHVAQTLRDASREVDICGRYGGEEFGVILPSTDADGARVFCERLRQTIADARVQVDECEVRYTISLGIAQFGAHIADAVSWIVCADKALYQSKEGGRNQVNVYIAQN